MQFLINFKSILFLGGLFLVFQACKNEQPKDETPQLTGIQSIDYWQTEVNANPDNPELYHNLGLAYYQENGFDGAISNFQKAISLDSTKPAYFHNLADALLDYGNSYDALITIQRAAGLFPDSIETLLNLTDFQFTLKQYTESINTIKQVFALDPLNPEAFFFMGMNYKELGDTVQAINSFQTTVEQDPEFLNAYLELAILCDKTKKDDFAIQYFDNALRIDSTDITTLYAKAMFYQNRYMDNEAILLYKKINKIDRNYAPAYFNVGTIFLEYDSLQQAYNHFDIAVNEEPTYALGYYYRGLTSEKMGKTEQAINDYKQSLAFDSNLLRAKESLKKLNITVE